MARQSKSQLTDEILDIAAGLFARHGFARTSVQQIAEALGYSKAGLLHHYPSKKVLFDAVIERYISDTEERFAVIMQTPSGIERDRVMVESAVDYAYNLPGMSALSHQIEREGLGEDPRLLDLGVKIMGALVENDPPDLGQIAQRLMALAGANVASQFAARVNMKSEFREHILAAAMATLGHDTAAKEGKAPSRRAKSL